MGAMNLPILSIITFFPTLGAIAILLGRGTPEQQEHRARFTALITTVATLALTLILL